MKIKASLAHMKPTSFCNFNCKHCGVVKTGKKVISFKKAKEFLIELKKNKIKNLIISGGGEPLVKFKRIVDIINLAKKYKIKVRLNTNGYFIAYKDPKSAVERLSNLDSLTLSVDPYHLRFISYSMIIKVIKTVLYSKINLRLCICFQEKDEHKCRLLIDKIAKDLNGKVLPLTGKMPYGFFNSYLILAKKIIFVSFYKCLEVTDNNKANIKINPIEIRKIIFRRCIDAVPALHFDSSITCCPKFIPGNNRDIYLINNLKDNSNPLYNIQNNIFPFIKLFLKIKKDNKLFKSFSKQKYYEACNFCLNIMKNRKHIEKIRSPGICDIVIFSILNIKYFLIESFERILYFFTNWYIILIIKILSILNRR